MSKNSHWKLLDTPPYETQGNLPTCLQNILAQRGLTDPTEISAFLSPRLKNLSDPFLIPEMELATTRLFQAIDQQERVVIYGDYDVDGTSSVTILKKILQAYGLNAQAFVPRRSTEGYGLNDAALKRCMEESPSNQLPDLLVSVDCGTISVGPIADLRAKGIDVIVIDHHEAGESERPDCNALVNPKFSTDPENDFGYLCAAGVVFKVAHALLRIRPLDDFDLKTLLDLAAIATICDIVPLHGENRILVKHGLRQMEKTAHPGLHELMKLASVKPPLSAQQMGFRIGPRLNAAGRMDQAMDTVEILSTPDPQRAEELAETLNNYNSQRQDLEQLALKQAYQQLANFDPDTDGAIVVGSPEWHPGVVGIVASRLMQKFHCPAFVIAFDDQGLGKGSGRSVQGISLVEAIEANRQHLEAGGGHHMAAGLSIQHENLDVFRTGFAKFVLESLPPEGRHTSLTIDAEVDFELLTLDFLPPYESLQPFGSANRLPVFMSKGIEHHDQPRLLQGKHYKFRFAQPSKNGNGQSTLDAIFFGSAERELPPTPWDIAYTIERNTFRGRTSLQAIIKDIRASE